MDSAGRQAANGLVSMSPKRRRGAVRVEWALTVLLFCFVVLCLWRDGERDVRMKEKVGKEVHQVGEVSVCCGWLWKESPWSFTTRTSPGGGGELHCGTRGSPPSGIKLKHNAAAIKTAPARCGGCGGGGGVFPVEAVRPPLSRRDRSFELASWSDNHQPYLSHLDTASFRSCTSQARLIKATTIVADVGTRRPWKK